MAHSLLHTYPLLEPVFLYLTCRASPKMNSMVHVQRLNTTQEIINGRYELQNEIGSGGMGIVLQAKDRLTGQRIALKRVYLNPDQPFPQSISQNDAKEKLRMVLAKEFKILAGLRHPNIISVLDYGFDGEKQPFYTMSHLSESQTILEAGEGLSLDGKIDLIEQLLQGLAYLHRHGILHRDIKPENVLVTDGVVRLLDFGLSHKASDEETTGGSILYIAPEVAELEEISRAADLYSVGVLFYQLIVGQHPFGELDAFFYDRLTEGEPDWAPVGKSWRPLLKSLLAKAPVNRPQSANDVLSTIASTMERPTHQETVEIRESYLQAATFIGREAEMDQLAAALQAAKEGQSSAWLVGGESGVGKSRLLDELQTMAMVDGWQVLRGGSAETAGLPYQLWRQIVPNLVLNTELKLIELSILKEIAPNIDALINKSIPVLSSSNGTIDQERLILTLVEAIRQQTQPTLFLLEDLHWMREGFAPLKHLLTRLEELPNVMIVGTYRNDERPTLPDQLSEAHLLVLDRLNNAEVQQLSQAMLGDRSCAPEVVALLTQETEGNTFFIIEVMRALAEEAGQLDEIGRMNLPAGVLTSGMEVLLQRRIARIPVSDQELLLKAAVAGRQLDLSLLKLLMPSMDMSGWLQRALDAAVLSVRDDQWLFSHDKLRETIIHGLNSRENQQLHREIAQGIEQLYPDDQSYDQTLLEHWHQAGDLDKELTYLEPVARNLVQAFADLTKAEELLNRGLSLLPDSDPRRVSLLNWLAYTLSEQFESQYLKKALELAEQATALAKQHNDKKGLATSLYYLGDIIFELDSSDTRANKCVQESLEYARSLGDQKQISINLSLLGEISHHRGHVDLAFSYHSEAIAIFKEINYYYGLGYSLDQLGQVVIIKGEYETASQYLNQSYEAFQAGGYIQRLGWTLLNAASPQLLLGRYDEAKNTLNHCLSYFQKYGVQAGKAYTYNNLGRVATLTGEFEEAKRYLHESSEIFKIIGSLRSVGYNLLQFGIIYSIEGNFEEAARYLEEAQTLFTEYKDLRFIAYSKARLGIVTMHKDPILAQNYLHEALEQAQSLNIEPCILECLFGMATLYLQQDRLIEAGQLVGLAIHHPGSNKEIHLWLQVIVPKLEEHLSATELEKALEDGKSLDFEKVVNSLLPETIPLVS